MTNTGPTVITGANLGVSPGSAIPGFPPGIVTAPGTIHATDAVAAQAQSDVTTAYNVLAGQSCSANLPTELGGLTLTPGVYCQGTTGLTGTLMLDALGDPNAVFVFKSASTLITAPNSGVRVINGGSACNVYWQVSSSATLDTNTAFIGNILALTSISVKTGATVVGRALARNGAVTLDNNRFTPNACAAAPISTPTTVPTVAPTTAPIATPVTGGPGATPVTGGPGATPVTGGPVPTLVTGAPTSIPARPATVQPQVVQPSAVQPVTGQPGVYQPVYGSAPNVPSASGNAPASGNIVTGPTNTTPAISATLPLVGSPVPIPVALSNTGGGGMATHFTTPAGGVGDSRTNRLAWVSIIALLVALASTGLLFLRRLRR